MPKGTGRPFTKSEKEYNKKADPTSKTGKKLPSGGRTAGIGNDNVKTDKRNQRAKKDKIDSVLLKGGKNLDKFYGKKNK